jgi:starch synthase
VFDLMTAQELLKTVQRALNAFHDKKIWSALQQNGMSMNFGWEESAAAYLKIYSGLKSA